MGRSLVDEMVVGQWFLVMNDSVLLRAAKYLTVNAQRSIRDADSRLFVARISGCPRQKASSISTCLFSREEILMIKHVKTVMLIALGVCLGLVVWFGLLTRVKGAAQGKPKRPGLSKLPPIKNCLEHVKLTKAELIMQGDAQVASLELENEAFVGVVSFSVEQVVDKHKNSTGLTGFTPDKPPIVVIAPGQRTVVTMGSLSQNPIRIGAAMFSDGTEEGCNSSLKELRESKESETRKGASQK
jgi:hypothetical protein